MDPANKRTITNENELPRYLLDRITLRSAGQAWINKIIFKVPCPVIVGLMNLTYFVPLANPFRIGFNRDLNAGRAICSHQNFQMHQF